MQHCDFAKFERKRSAILETREIVFRETTVIDSFGALLKRARFEHGGSRGASEMMGNQSGRGPRRLEGNLKIQILAPSSVQNMRPPAVPETEMVAKRSALLRPLLTPPGFSQPRR